MSRRLRFAIAGAALTGLAGAGMLSQATPSFAASSPSAAEQFIADINALRASVGAGALRENSTLDSMATGWSLHLESVGTLSHNPSLTSEAPSNWQKLGENVGVGPNVAALQTAFTNSPEHYANMVDPAFNQIGVNVQIDSNGYMWVTEDYMEAPLAAPAPTQPAPTPTTVPVVHSQPAPVVHTTPTTLAAPVVRAASLPVSAPNPAPTAPPTTSAPAVAPPTTSAPAPLPGANLAGAAEAPSSSPVTPLARPASHASADRAASGPRSAGAVPVDRTAQVTKSVAGWVRDLTVPAALLVLALVVIRRPRRHRKNTALA